MMNEDPTIPAKITASPLPSGTLTFLFTDVGGSSQLWEKYPEQWSIPIRERPVGREPEAQP